MVLTAYYKLKYYISVLNWTTNKSRNTPGIKYGKTKTNPDKVATEGGKRDHEDGC